MRNRAAGVFLHPTSLPSPYGIGDMGESAYSFIDMLAANSQSFWQMCPLGPTGFGDSPYQCLSSFAGNAVLISLKRMMESGLITDGELAAFPHLSDDRVDYTAVAREKDKLFRAAFGRFKPTDDFRRFVKKHKDWLDDYALYMALKGASGGQPWYEWDTALRMRRREALADAAKKLEPECAYHRFIQYVFFCQWAALRAYANNRGVKIIGDIPYYVAYDSCDAWTAPEVFEFDADGKRERVGGVPPDYFSSTGQLWGNPLYRWKKMAADGYAWWIHRFQRTLEMVDVVRIDHFRGFESYWAVPAGNDTAIHGTWVKGPGLAFFTALKEKLGALPVIAEDLGMITDEVRALIDTTGLPGMKVLQFAFDWNPDNPYLPHNIPENSVVYTGTHDNNTSVGWYQELSENDRGYVRMYLACSDEGFLDYFLRAAYISPARICIIPLQDIMGLDGTHRFNTPGTGEGNWRWRFRWDMMQGWMLERMRRYTEMYGRGKK